MTYQSLFQEENTFSCMKKSDTISTISKAPKYLKNRDEKKSNRYTDPDTGKRVYEINSYRLPSVTTILGATKDQKFLKRLEGESWRTRSRTN